MNEGNAIAFFDFDGTITTKDIFWDYLFYRIKNGLSPAKLILSMPYLLLYIIKVLNNEQAKQAIFSKLFRRENVTDFSTSVNKYLAKNLSKRLKNDAINRIAWHKNQNHTVCIVSANFDPLLANFASDIRADLICTEIEVVGNILTGRFATPNCYGAQKVVRIRNKYTDLSKYNQIFAYGDSKGDQEMLAIATDPFYRYFNK